MHRLMLRPRTQVKHFVFLDQFSGDPPLRGSPGVLAPHGTRIEPMHRLMLRPRMQVKQLVFLNQFSGDPPLRGSPGVLAPHGTRIEWQCVASCRGPDRK